MLEPRHRLKFLRFGLAIGLVGLIGCGAPYNDEIEEHYPDGDFPALQHIQLSDRSLQYVEMPGAGGTPLLFIHGSPGNWQAWSAFLNHPALADFGPRLAVDRPGFGGSQAGGIVTDLRQQGKLLGQLLPQDQATILVGHSLGSPVAAWMAIDFPQSICGVISIAGSLAPALEGMRWYNEVATWKVFHPLIPKALIDSNHEMQGLQDELNLLNQAWTQLQRPMIALQGQQDELVNPATADYLETVIDASLLSVQRFPNEGHFLLWESPNLVTDAIIQLNNSDCRSETHNL